MPTSKFPNESVTLDMTADSMRKLMVCAHAKKLPVRVLASRLLQKCVDDAAKAMAGEMIEVMVADGDAYGINAYAYHEDKLFGGEENE